MEYVGFLFFFSGVFTAGFMLAGCLHSRQRENSLRQIEQMRRRHQIALGAANRRGFEEGSKWQRELNKQLL